MARPAMAAVVAVLVLLSGCAGLTGTDDGTPATPETPNETPDEYPAGGSANSLGNVSQLNASTVNALGNTSYTMQLDATGTSENVSSGLISIEQSDAGMLMTFESEGDGTDQEVWSSGPTEKLAISQTEDGETEYTMVQNTSMFAGILDNFDEFVAGPVVTTYGNAFNYTHTDAYQQNGMWVHEYESTGINESYGDADETTSNMTSGNVTMTVREDGVVLGINGTITQESATGEAQEQNITYTLSDLGSTTTSAPDWYTEEFPDISGEFTQNEKVLKLTHNGGPALEETTQATVSVEFTSAELDRLEAGDTVYATATETSDGQLDVTVSRTEPNVGSNAVNLSDRGASFSASSMDGVTIRLTYGDTAF